MRGYRTLRVAGGVTFWLSGAGKSVLEVVGVNLKDGQNVLVLWRLFGVLLWGSWCWRWLFHCESVRGPLICLGGAWAGRLRRRSSLCQAAGTSLAALPAALPAVL